MNVMVWDVETNGLPDFKARSHDPKQPHIVELAMIHYDDAGNELSAMSVIVKPDGWEITEDMTAIHGISHERALQEGIAENDVIALWLAGQARAAIRVAHNISFDARLARIAMVRAGYQRDFIEMVEGRQSFCTCNSSKAIVKAPPTEKMLAAGFTGFKSPNLGECVRHFFPGEVVEGLHGALADARYCGRIYWELMKGKPA